MSKNDEQILVIPRTTLFGADDKLAFQGFKSTEEFEINGGISVVEVKRRGDMELDPTFKQLITYAILKDEATNKFLLYKRLGGSGETRLVDKTSIGVGGHTNWYEAETLEEVMFENFIRELEEELNIYGETTSRPVGFVNGDLNEVDKVHLGVIYVVNVDSTKVSVNETDTLEIEWLSLEEIKNDENLESWSRILVSSDEFLKTV